MRTTNKTTGQLKERVKMRTTKASVRLLTAILSAAMFFSIFMAMPSAAYASPPLLTAPSGLEAESAGPRYYGIALKWLDNSENEKGFTIARKISNGAWNDNFKEVPANTTSFADLSVQEGNAYYYKVRAYTRTMFFDVQSGWSNEAQMTAKLNTPTNLTLTMGTDNIKLQWSDNSNAEVGYHIERKIDNGNWEFYKSVTVEPRTSYTDFDVETGAKYTYRVFCYAYGGFPTSDYSNEASILMTGGKLRKPDGLTATGKINGIQLTWNDTPYEFYYIIFRGEENGVYSMIGDVNANTTSFLDTSAEPSKKYFYKVQGGIGFQNPIIIKVSDFSNEASAIRPAIMQVEPTPPQDVTAAITLQPSNISVTEGQNAFFETGSSLSTATYQWQCAPYTGGATVWGNISNGGEYSGANTKKLTITNVPATFNGAKYRCVVRNYAVATNSNEATLTVIAAAVTAPVPAPDSATPSAPAAPAAPPAPGSGTAPVPTPTPPAPSSGSAPTATGSMANFKPINKYIPGQFSDVDEDEWYGYNKYKSIANAFEYGLMKGNSATTFNPTGDITVEEAITVAARVHSIYMTGADSFAPSEPWSKVYVDYAIANGIIEANDFRKLERAASRAEMAYIFSRSLPDYEFPKKNTVNSLPDVVSGFSSANGKPQTPHYRSIIMLYEAGVLAGNDDAGTFNPNANINRAEAAAIISRVILPDTRKAGKVFG